MAFCPECGKAATADASRCIHCGHELDSKAAAAKGGAGARFKGTMMMAAPAIAKPAAKPAPVAAAAPAPAPVAAAPVAAAPAVSAPAAQAPAKTQAKQTMIGTGIGPLAGAAKAAAPAAVAAPVARAPVAPAAPAPEAKRNMAFAQTQHQAAFAAAPPAAAAPAPRAAAPAAPAAPAIEPLGVAVTPVAPRPEPEPEPERQQHDSVDEDNYLPGDPMAPQATTQARSPMLRYDDSIPELPRHNPLQDKKLLLIAAGVIGFICLTLVMVLISKLMN